jgi:hypothetical protein
MEAWFQSFIKLSKSFDHNCTSLWHNTNTPVNGKGRPIALVEECPASSVLRKCSLSSNASPHRVFFLLVVKTTKLPSSSGQLKNRYDRAEPFFSLCSKVQLATTNTKDGL